MRARLALLASGTTCELREVVLRDKPDEMLALSPKGTVPVLRLSDGTVIEESLDIATWAISRHDPEGWMPSDPQVREDMFELIARNDGPFKHNLDRYKYPGRYDDVDPRHHRTQGAAFLADLDERLRDTGHLFEGRTTLGDMAIMPFVRQFANVDRAWFDALELPRLREWLEGHLTSDRFASVMIKHPKWEPNTPPVSFPG